MRDNRRTEKSKRNDYYNKTVVYSGTFHTINEDMSSVLVDIVINQSVVEAHQNHRGQRSRSQSN